MIKIINQLKNQKKKLEKVHPSKAPKSFLKNSTQRDWELKEKQDIRDLEKAIATLKGKELKLYNSEITNSTLNDQMKIVEQKVENLTFQLLKQNKL